MKQRLFTILSAVSLLLLIAFCALWIRGASRAETISVFWKLRPHPTSPAIPLVSVLRAEHHRGHTRLVYAPKLCPPRECWPDSSGNWRRWRYTHQHTSGVDEGQISVPKLPEGASFGFHHRTATASRVLWVPDYAVAICLALLPVFSLMFNGRRWVRRSRGLCPSCGYDMRATPERCPECGTAANAQSP